MIIEIDQDVQTFLEHHGVKGQKWGVRRNPKTGVRPLAKTLNDSLFGRVAQKNVDRHDNKVAAKKAKKLAKADDKWQKNIYTVGSAVQIHNRVADKMNNGGIAKLNSDPRFKGSHLTRRPNAPETKAYIKEYERMNEQFTRQAVKEIHGTSPSGGYKATLSTAGGDWSVKVSPVNVQHADDPFPTLIMELTIDPDTGMIDFQKQVKDIMAQSALGQAFIEHHGVKGQKWGVRRARAINAKRAAKGKNPVKASQQVGNKVTRGAAYVASYMIGSSIGALAGGNEPGTVATSVGAVVGSVAGVVFANQVLKNVGHKRTADVYADDQ